MPKVILSSLPSSLSASLFPSRLTGWNDREQEAGSFRFSGRNRVICKRRHLPALFCVGPVTMEPAGKVCRDEEAHEETGICAV